MKRYMKKQQRMDKINRIKILNIAVAKISYEEIIDFIEKSLEGNKKRIISYAAFHVINLAKKSILLSDEINSFDIVHADGIGVYLASKFLYGKDGIRNKITGSDFYSLLINQAIQKRWNLFFFGDELKTLEKIKTLNPGLKISGYVSGYDFIDEEIINEINLARSDILVVGLGCPKQENWVYKNRNLINTKIILIVGDGIKVFAGTKKRGNKIIQKIGAEWFIRLLSNPSKMWKRYLIGIPLFFIRVLKFKKSKKASMVKA